MYMVAGCGRMAVLDVASRFGIGSGIIPRGYIQARKDVSDRSFGAAWGGKLTNWHILHLVGPGSELYAMSVMATLCAPSVRRTLISHESSKRHLLLLLLLWRWEVVSVNSMKSTTSTGGPSCGSHCLRRHSPMIAVWGVMRETGVLRGGFAKVMKNGCSSGGGWELSGSPGFVVDYQANVRIDSEPFFVAARRGKFKRAPARSITPPPSPLFRHTGITN